MTGGGVVVTKMTVDGVEWERFEYAEDDVLYQRKCPDCEGGLLLAPARFHARCGGSGYLVTTVVPR